MKLTLHTEGWYDAAHHLNNYEGACANNHGHTYKVEVWVKGETGQQDEAGILWDFGNLKSIIKKYDHVTLNGIEPFDKVNATAENQCQDIYLQLKTIDPHLQFKVRVYEQLAPKESYCDCGDWE